MKRYLFSFFVALVLCLTLPYRLCSSALVPPATSDPFNNFTYNISSYYLSKLSDYAHKYWILVAYPSTEYSSFIQEPKYSLMLYTLYDITEDDNFYFPTESNTFPYMLNFTIDNTTHKYQYNCFGVNKAVLSSGAVITSSMYSINAPVSHPLVMDFYNSDVDFPFYLVGSPPVYTRSAIILGSNCDIYDTSSNLLQSGSYENLVKICPYLSGVAENLSSYEPPTQPPTYSGYEQEQASNSRTIIGKLTDVWNSISALPSAIAQSISCFFDTLGDRISGFFDNLLDGIINGLQYLFVPSDNNFDDLITLIRSKFGFITQIIDLSNFLLTTDFSQQKPSFTITIPDVGEVTTFNDMLYFVYDRWRTLAHNIMIACMVYLAYRKLKHRAVDVINGESPKEG